MSTPPDQPRGRYRLQLYLLLLIGFTAVLAFLSLRSTSGAPQLFSGQDKVGHFLAYGLTAWLACQALALRFRIGVVLIVAFVYATLTGSVLELLQARMTTTRHAEWSDLVANLFGSSAGCAVFCLMRRFKYRHESD